MKFEITHRMRLVLSHWPHEHGPAERLTAPVFGPSSTSSSDTPAFDAFPPALRGPTWGPHPSPFRALRPRPLEHATVGISPKTCRASRSKNGDARSDVSPPGKLTGSLTRESSSRSTWFTTTVTAMRLSSRAPPGCQDKRLQLRTEFRARTQQQTKSLLNSVIIQKSQHSFTKKTRSHP